MTMPAYVPDKEELRAKLSLHYVCAKLGIQLDRDDRALCPFHADGRPSLYLWDGDDGNTRWHCQPCGFGGDIFDLIQRKEGLTFTESVIRAAALLAELPHDYTPPARQPAANRVSPDDFAHEVQAARTLAASQGHEGILALRAKLTDDEDAAKRWDKHLREWGWGIGADGTGNVFMPHWTSDGKLTGCKLRLRDGSKQSIPGSRYEQLYGAWRGRQHQAVLLTEGETDAVYASWLAKKEGIGVDVFALPSGANKPVDVQYLDFIRGAKPLYLAFDPDDAGVDATRRWFQSFFDTGFSEIRVCCLPLGRDLREAQPVLADLLEQSRKPFPIPDDIAAGPVGYVRQDRNGNQRLATNWTVDPVAQLAGEGEAGYDAVLFAQGRQEKIVIRLADLATSQALNKWANAQGLTFTGTDADRVSITKMVQARGCVTPEVFQTDRVGLHYPPAQYQFAGPSIALPEGRYLGHLPWRYAPTGKGAGDVTGRVLLPSDATFRWRNLEAFLALSGPDVMHPILAWLCAAARRPEVREFPLLFVGGSSGVGKSTLARLATRLLGSTIEIDLGSNTPFTMLRILASSTSLPIFVDEWTRLSRRDTREAFQGTVPLLYTGGMAERGQSDLSTIQYRMTAPTIVAGEDTFALDRELQRTVRVYPTHAAQNVRALAYLHGQPIEAFGQILHHWLSGEPDLPPFPVTAPTRDNYNRLILETGWATLLALLTDQAGHSQAVPDLPPFPDLSCLERTEDEQDENVYVTALMECAALTDPGGIPVVWADPEGRGTWVRFVALIGLLETRRFDIQLPGRSRAMRAYFAERYGELEAGRPTPPLGMKPAAAHLIPGLKIDEEDEA